MKKIAIGTYGEDVFDRKKYIQKSNNGLIDC
jgi:hypothetical protein